MNNVRIRSLIIGMVASAAIGLASSLVFAQVRHDASAVGLSNSNARAELAARLSQTNVMQKGGTDLKAGGDRSRRIVDELTNDQVTSALAATTHAELESAVFGSQAARDLLSTLIEKGTSVAGIIKALGDSGADLVYTPLTPCRIMDTRGTPWSAAAPLLANTQRGFDVRNATTIAAQGGVQSGGCGVISGSRAIAVNITAISPAAGWLYAWPWPAAIPNASILNWAGASTGAIANSTVLTVDYTDGPAAYIQTPVGGTNVIMDVQGYFANPTATALSCTNVAMTGSTGTITGLRYVSSSCPAGYTVTGGSCDTSNSSAGPITGMFVLANGWECESNNYPGSSTAYFISGNTRCCRVPGR